MSERVVLSVSEHPEFLAAAFRIYEGRFAPTEIETIEVLEGYLKTEWWKMFVCVEDGEVIGGIHLNFLEAAPKTAVIEHIYVRRDRECQEAGTRMWQHVETNVFPQSGVELVMLEMEDPALMSEEEVRDVERLGVSLTRRVKFWQMRNFLKADAPYLQGILEGADDGCYNLSLLMKWVDSNKPHQIDTKDYLEINRAFAATYLSHEPESDPFFLRIKAALDQDGRKKIDLLMPTSDRSFFEC